MARHTWFDGNALLASAALLGGCDSAEQTFRVNLPMGGAAGVSGAAGAGGAAGGSGGQAWVSPVAAEVSQRWTWQECGRIAPSPVDPTRHDGLLGIQSLAISDDGSLLVSNAMSANTVIGWRVAEVFDDSRPLWKTGAEGGINVALSPDGRLGSISGDVRLIFDTATGETLFGEGSADSIGPLPPCIGSELNFSPDGRFVAGKHYSPTVHVLETETFQAVGYFSTSGCGQGLAFSADSQTIATPDGRAQLAELSATMPADAQAPTATTTWASLTLAPDGSFVAVTCPDFGCSLGSGPTWSTRGRHLDISAEGHWYLRGRELRHMPSGEMRLFDEAALAAVFAPNGDIIAGDADASLVRFCRSD